MGLRLCGHGAQRAAPLRGGGDGGTVIVLTLGGARPYTGISGGRAGQHVECEGKFCCEEFR